jgi:hypothetical protein
MVQNTLNNSYIRSNPNCPCLKMINKYYNGDHNCCEVKWRCKMCFLGNKSSNFLDGHIIGSMEQWP